MGTPAAVEGDRVVGACAAHLVPDPLGAPMKAPPMPFSAPLLEGLVLSVLVGGRPVAVVGSSGVNTPPHVGLHPSDPYALPLAQVGRVVVGSPTVYAGGLPVARTGSTGSLCASPGMVEGSVAAVEVA